MNPNDYLREVQAKNNGQQYQSGGNSANSYLQEV